MPHPLTKGIRRDIEQRVKVVGGISRDNANILLHHIDLLTQLLEFVMDEGQEWTDKQWTTFIEGNMYILDSIDTSAKRFKKIRIIRG